MTDDEERALVEKTVNIMVFIAIVSIVLFWVAVGMWNADTIVAWIGSIVSKW